MQKQATTKANFMVINQPPKMFLCAAYEESGDAAAY